MPRCTDLFTTAPAADGRTALAVRTWPGLRVPGVTVHPLARGDTRTVERVFDGLSARSRLTRIPAVPRPAPGRAGQLADVDHDDHGAWVAHASGAPVGIGRYVRLADPAVAQIALEVVDAYQGLGLGRLLLDVVGAAAADVGVRRLRWLVDATDTPARRLAGRLGGEFTHDGHGLVEATTALPPVPAAAAAEVARCAAAARCTAAVRTAA
jgi:GNAT superfamily N-acetyltransferase